MKTLKTVLIALACVLLAAYAGSGVYYSFYSPERSSTYLWAVYHVHSTMSDGLLRPEEIARQARAAGVSLVVLTDHGSPNLKSSTFRKVIDGVTVVGGSEASLPEGHLTFFGAAAVPLFKLPPFLPAALDDLALTVGIPRRLTLPSGAATSSTVSGAPGSHNCLSSPPGRAGRNSGAAAVCRHQQISM